MVPEDDTTKKHLAALEILWPYTRQNPPDLQELSLAKQGYFKYFFLFIDFCSQPKTFCRPGRFGNSNKGRKIFILM